ncbi:MAG: hypothetical protein O3A13_08415 [Proteobacteria bacterium]|nr:hypothetical protein [Pseudomonadota bacterium]MDA0993642.1 hypothetical protein [Pseudomonadota bacterium]
MKTLQTLPLVVLLILISPCAFAEPDLSGIWMLSGRAIEGELLMTERALALQAEYDLLVDDPSLYCEPASASRVWANPNVRIAFDQTDEHVLISYEFYDLRREIPLGNASSLSDQPSTKNVDGTYFDKMGSSFARYEGDRLIIESRNHSPGYIRTSRGVPQSANTVAIEELWIDEETLRLTHTYIDDSLFEKPFVVDYSFRRTGEAEMPLYECTDANYDWFEQLNAPKEEEKK